jgi:spore germination protein KB
MEAKIDRLQYFLMVPNLVFGKAIGITAGIMMRKIGADTWTSMLIGFMIGTMVILLLTFLGSRFPDKTIVQYSEELLGKWFGRGIGLLLALFFIMAFGASANTMTLHLKEYFLPNTPFLVICILYTLLCMYGVFLGVEVAVRFSMLGFVMIVLITLAMISGTFQDVKWINLLPLFDKGFLADIWNSVYIFGDIGMAILAIGFLYPMLNQKGKGLSLTFWGMLLGCALVVIWPMFETAVMGTGLSKQYMVVCMEQIRCAQLTKYFPRYELLMVSFFTFSVAVQSIAMFYCAQYSFKQVLGVKKDWFILIPLTVILILVTYYLAHDPNRYIGFLAFPYPQISVILSIGLPVILFFAALVKGKLKKKTSNS